MNQTQEATRNKPRDPSAEPNLDILRAMAVGFVLYAHVAGRDPFVRTAIGRFGVLIFFVHTSLVLMSSLERVGLEGPGMFAVFYVRRAFRLYPLSVFAVLLAALVHAPSFADEPYRALTPGQLWSNVLLVQNLTRSPSNPGPLWSLPYEVQMYLLLPCIYLLVRARSGRAVFALWAAVALVCIPSLPAWLSVGNFAPCFLGGILAWRMRRRNWMPSWLWPLLITVACALFCQPYLDRKYAGWLVCLLLGGSIPQFRPAGNRAVVFLAHSVAKYSYGIYLSHEPLLWLVFRHLQMPRLLRWAVFPLLLVLVPVAAYHLIEDPCIKLGASLAKKLGKRMAAPARPAATAVES